MIIEILSYPFLVRALLVGFFVSLSASLLGVSLVLRRFSMIGDGLSHVGFGALGISALLSLQPMAVTIPVVVLSAFVLLRLSERSKGGDSSIALSRGDLRSDAFLLPRFLSSDICGDIRSIVCEGHRYKHIPLHSASFTSDSPDNRCRHEDPWFPADLQPYHLPSRGCHEAEKDIPLRLCHRCPRSCIRVPSGLLHVVWTIIANRCKHCHHPYGILSTVIPLEVLPDTLQRS